VDWLSILLVAVIGFLTWRAYANGFVRELVSLCAVILAIPMAGIFYDDMYPKVSPIISNDTVAALVSFLSIMAGVIILGQVAAHLIKRVVAVLNLGAADQLAGGLFGFLKAVIVIQVILIALVHFPRPDIRDRIDESPIATRLLDYSPLPLAILPGDFDDALDQFLDGVVPALDTDSSPTPEEEVEVGGE
jgi:membrane protein required for colicin V production